MRNGKGVFLHPAASGEAGILHHALSRQHAGDGPDEYRVRDYLAALSGVARVLVQQSRFNQRLVDSRDFRALELYERRMHHRAREC